MKKSLTFSATGIAFIAMFTALAYAVSFLEFPIFPAADNLKLDFGNVFFMIEGFIFGPVEAIISIAVKEFLCFLTKSSTQGVGEIANFLMSTAYIIIPSIAYKFKKGRLAVLVYMVVACAAQVGVSFVVNRYINYPVFGAMFDFDGVALFKSTWYFVILFNLIKSVSISIVVFIAYKPLSRFIKSAHARFKNMRKMNKSPRPSDTQTAEENSNGDSIKEQANGDQSGQSSAPADGEKGGDRE